MFKYRAIFFYFFVIISVLALGYIVISKGEFLQSKFFFIGNYSNDSINFFNHFNSTFQQNFHHPLAILLLQIITIIFTARTFGFLVNQIGQPTVIGEIFAGIFLGPSILGYWFPAYSNYLFPTESLANLEFLSQVGLVLFMFVIGMELDLKILRNQIRDSIIISHTGILFPFLFGIILAYFLFTSFAPQKFGFLPFSLFIGISMSITAFPVLARILQERDMSKTKFGNFVITCAATDDITAWCILALIIAIAKAGSFISAIFTIILVLFYVFVMLKFIRPFLKKLGEVFSNKETISISVVSLVFGILLISAFITEILGIHALFGAFLAGVIMPQGVNFRRLLIEKVESVSVGLLLPLFFVLTGLRTQIGLLGESDLWGLCGIVILIASLGKSGGIVIASRVSGLNWKESLTLGVLMNTRGLMELVVLNIGYDLGILSPELFVVFVIMALVTTFTTVPALNLLGKFYKSSSSTDSSSFNNKFRILLSFANPNSGKKLARIASVLVGKTKEKTFLTALHVTPTADINTYQVSEYEKESFRPIKLESQRLELSINFKYKVSNDVSEEIISESNSGKHDLMLVGVGQSIFSGSLLGQVIGITANAFNPDKLIGAITGKNHLFRTKSILDDKSNEFLNRCKIPIGVFIDHELERIDEIIIPVVSISDLFLFFYARKIVNNSNVRISLLDFSGVILSNAEILDEVNALENLANNRFVLHQRQNFSMNEFRNSDLVVLSMDGFNKLSGEVDLQDKEFSSLLILRQ